MFVRAVKLFLLSLLSLCTMAFGANQHSSKAGLGLVAENLMEPITVFSDFIHTSCLLIGGAFIFASIIKYIEHKRSPLMVPISTVVFLAIAGLFLVLLPFVTYYTGHRVTYMLD